MQTRLMSRGPLVSDEIRIFSIRLDPGDEIIERLAAFATENSVERGVFEAIGGFEDFTLAYYDVPTKRFMEVPVASDQVEVLSLTGQVALGADPPVHVHTVLGHRNGTAFGGHLLRAVVQPVLLVSLTETMHEIEPHHV